MRPFSCLLPTPHGIACDRVHSAPNYARTGDACLPVSATPIAQPAYCPLGTYYSTPSGYRRIPASTCQGGATLDTPIQRPCGTQSRNGQRMHGPCRGA